MDEVVIEVFGKVFFENFEVIVWVDIFFFKYINIYIKYSEDKF